MPIFHLPGAPRAPLWMPSVVYTAQRHTDLRLAHAVDMRARGDPMAISS
jgi:hypothetical protein